MSTAPFYTYWGKAQPAADQHGGWYLLPYQSLDVPAVGQIYLQQQHRLRVFLAETLGLSESRLLVWTTFFLALHDLGKFSDGFQNLRADILQQLQQRTSTKRYSVRHDSLGLLFWQKALWPRLAQATDWD